mmetsp:Transcript_4324/g.8117  ORF Transcript_4324/g.8117 Transcript_4324/m.8117 type:complete len:334 (-) Transcript_4324:21-1022(-)
MDMKRRIFFLLSSSEKFFHSSSRLSSPPFRVTIIFQRMFLIGSFTVTRGPPPLTDQLEPPCFSGSERMASLFSCSKNLGRSESKVSPRFSWDPSVLRLDAIVSKILLLLAKNREIAPGGVLNFSTHASSMPLMMLLPSVALVKTAELLFHRLIMFSKVLISPSLKLNEAVTLARMSLTCVRTFLPTWRTPMIWKTRSSILLLTLYSNSVTISGLTKLVSSVATCKLSSPLPNNSPCKTAISLKPSLHPHLLVLEMYFSALMQLFWTFCISITLSVIAQHFNAREERESRSPFCAFIMQTTMSTSPTPSLLQAADTASSMKKGASLAPAMKVRA